MSWTKEEREEWQAKQVAPPGYIWVCAACGRKNADRSKFSDEACFVNAILCKKNSTITIRPLHGSPVVITDNGEPTQD